MRPNRSFLAGALAAALCAPLAAQAANPPALAPYELNAIIPLTGAGAFLGKAYVDGFKALEYQVNSTGGIQGHPLKFVMADTQSSGQVDVQLVNGLIAKHVPVFIDGAPANVCQPSIPLVAKDGPVDYCLSPAIHPPSGGYVFSVNASTTDMATVELRFAKAHGWKRVGVIVSNDTSGQDYDRQMPIVFAAPEFKDMQLVGTEHFNPSDISITAQVTRLKAANPQVILALTTGTPLGTVLRSLHDAGTNLPVMTNNPNMSRAQMAAYATFMPDGLYFPSLRSMTPEGTLPGPLKDKQTVYVNAFKHIGVKPEIGHVMLWDSSMIIIDALRKYGPNATAQQIHEYILGLHGWIGANGVYDFASGDQRGVGQNSIIVAKWAPEQDMWIQVSRPRGVLK